MASLPTNQTEKKSNAKYAQENRKYCDTREKHKALLLCLFRSDTATINYLFFHYQTAIMLYLIAC